PPTRSSQPSPPQITSSPPPPWIRSLPDSPAITSAPAVPWMVSDLVVPTIVATRPPHVTAWRSAASAGAVVANNGTPSAIVPTTATAPRAARLLVPILLVTILRVPILLVTILLVPVMDKLWHPTGAGTRVVSRPG